MALSATIFGWDLASEPHFMDESAYISQSFYADLWLARDWDNLLWLTYAGYDLPPLPKYAIGTALKSAGYRRPGPPAMVAWYRNPKSRFETPDLLVAARRPSVTFGALGCLAIYALGTMAVDRRVGLLSALLLMLNPLYAMHARRAMSDVYAESLLLATLAVGLWAWKRILAGSGKAPVPILALVVGSGILGGLGTLSKLNGSLALMTLGDWALLAIAIARPRDRGRRVVASTIAAGCVSLIVFVALNPFVFAKPKGPVDPVLESFARMNVVERLKVISDHRVGVSEGAKSQFPDDALRTPMDKLKAVAVQGFGRFGPFGPRGGTDSTIRYSWAQDGNARIWLPWATIGLGFALALGWRQFRAGQPPAAWAIVGQAAIALVVVTAFIPLAWDRYFLSIQPGMAILGSIAVVGCLDLVRSAFGRRPLTESTA